MILSRILLYLLFHILITYCSAFAFAFNVPVVSEIKDMFDDEVKKTSQHIAKGLHEEFKKATDDLFNNKIEPLLDEIDEIIQNRIEHADKIIKKRLHQTETIIKNSMLEIRKGISDFDNVLQKTSININKLRISFKKDVNDIFDRLDKTIDCRVEAVAEKIISDVENIKKSFIPVFPFFKHECYKILDIKEVPERWEYATIYKLQKCKKMNELDNNSSIDTILRAYIDLRALCSRVGCIQRLAGDPATEYFNKEYLELGRKYYIWSTTQK